MMNWGKQSAFDMFSNLMTFQALASQQGQAQDVPVDHPCRRHGLPSRYTLSPVPHRHILQLVQGDC